MAMPQRPLGLNMKLSLRASDHGNLIRIPVFFPTRSGKDTGKIREFPGISRCAKIEQDPAFPAGKSGTFENSDRKTGKTLNPGGVSGIQQWDLTGNSGILRFSPAFPGFLRLDLNGKIGKFKIPASFSGISPPGSYRENREI